MSPTPRSPTDGLSPPTLVEDAEALERLLDQVDGQKVLAVDTEADSFFHYQERVCLIQVTVGDEDYLVDPLADLDISPLGDVLANPDQVKIFHDGEYDVLIMKREFGFEFAGLFDTRIAAAALGNPSPGLASVLDERFGVTLDKSLQRSDWSRRPLSSKQIDYARLDTRFLEALMDEQLQDLERLGRLPIVEGECRRLEALEPAPRVFEPDEFIRIKGARTLRPVQMQVLRELFILRDGLAHERDLPPFKILSNPNLFEIAKSRARAVRQLNGVPGLSPKHIKRFGNQIVEAIERGWDAGPLKEIPRLPAKDGTSELDEIESELHERLKIWRKEESNRHKLDSSLILNRLVLLRLAQTRPRTAAALAEVEGLIEWQRELFGDDLLDVITRFEDDVQSGKVPTRRRRRR